MKIHKPVLPAHRDLYYGGAWHGPSSGAYFEVTSPGSGESLGQVADASAADVDGAVASLDAMLYPQLRAKRLTFGRSDCNYFILADPEKLQQILLNLATNAIKFTPAGGISVRCRSDDATVTIDVTDTGVGIPPDKLEQIFEPFIQVNRSLTNVSHDGVGLGLAISRNLARAMGGELAATSTPGEGSTFSLSLPRAYRPVAVPA